MERRFKMSSLNLSELSARILVIFRTLDLKMKLCIITQEINNKSCQILKMELEKLGHQVDFIEYKKSRLIISTSTDEKRIIYDAKLLEPRDYDGVMLREWGYCPEIGEEVMSIFENAGVTSVNPKIVRSVASSKIKTYEILNKKKVAQPLAAVYTHSELPTLQQLLDDGFNPPFIIKKDISCRAKGVWLCENYQELYQVSSDKFSDNEPFLLQQFIDTAKQKGSFQFYRVNVIQNKVTGVKLCYSSETPIVNGSKAVCENQLVDESKVLASPVLAKMANLAIKASEAIGIEIAGVDLVIEVGTNNIYVLEVNDSPVISVFNDLGYSTFAETVATFFSEKVLKHSHHHGKITDINEKMSNLTRPSSNTDEKALVAQRGFFAPKTCLPCIGNNCSAPSLGYPP